MRSVRARPFVKWAGGKQALARTLIGVFPPRFGRYYEPFLGGGSVLFELRCQSAVVCDRNPWLMDTYRAIRDRPERVAQLLDGLVNTKRNFLAVRAQSPAGLDRLRRAAHFIYLNKTCFRGLFRVNRSGCFNVPYGGYDRRLYDLENLAAVAEALAAVELRCGDFSCGLEGIGPGDFAYLDPPYVKLGGYADFNRYTPEQFREQDHRRLAEICAELDRAGVLWAVSNSDTPLVRRLFAGHQLHRLAARREINLNARARDQVELLITNY